MDDENLEELIGLVSKELKSVGLNDAADLTGYLVVNPETDEAELPPRDQLLVEMLKAFDRAMAIRDIGTYNKAVENFEEVMGENAPKRIVCVSALDKEIDLSTAPDLSGVRLELKKVMDDLNGPTPGPKQGPAPPAPPAPGMW